MICFSFLEQCEPPHDMLLCPPEKQRFAPRKSNHLPQKVLSFSRNPRYNKGIVCIFSDSGKEFCRFWGKVCYYNLSPQGDGNAHRRLTSSLRENYNLSPQGDGNLLVLVPADVANDYNLSPQGDGNPIFCYTSCSCFQLLQFIPARGQKSTSATGVCQQRRCFAFSYILLYRLGAAPAGIVFVTGSALTPCGTSGFMGRISCR